MSRRSPLTAFASEAATETLALFLRSQRAGKPQRLGLGPFDRAGRELILATFGKPGKLRVEPLEAMLELGLLRENLHIEIPADHAAHEHDDHAPEAHGHKPTHPKIRV